MAGIKKTEEEKDKWTEGHHIKQVRLQVFNFYIYDLY